MAKLDEDAQVTISEETNSPPLIKQEDISKNLKIKPHDRSRIVFFGTPEFILPVLEALDLNFELVAIVTTPDAPVGRKQIMTPTAAAQFGRKIKIPVLKPAKLDETTAAQLQKFSADLFIVASYGKIIPQSVLDIPRNGSINIHPSKLPHFRGATPIQSQLLEGIIDSAISFIILDAKMDHGPLLHQEPFTISPVDTNETLHTTMFVKAAEVVPKIIEQFVCGDIQSVEQDHEQATFCKPFNRDSGYFELDSPPSPAILDRMIRAFYPWPTAWTRWNGKILKFLPNQMVQPEGKKPMKWKEFLNGYRDFPNRDLL